MNVDFEALIALTTEKSIPVLSIIEGIEQEVIALYRELPDAKPHARVRVARDTGEIHIWVPTFNEEGVRESEEIHEPEGFDKVAMATIRKVIRLKMRETNDAEIVGEFSASVGDVVSGIVQQGRDPKMIHVNLGRVEGRVPPQEQVPGEVYVHGDRIKCFVGEV